jgi:catechol 2,3-dioxygenase-like lactoylglutathione lyase family enzyme
MPMQFRFAYFTRRYEATLEFYRAGLGFPVVEAWDRSADDRGTIFAAAGGMIEVLSVPQGESDHLFDARPPQGAFMVIEVDDVDARHREVKARGLALQEELEDRPWGHRAFCLRDPNGLTLYLFSER